MTFKRTDNGIGNYALFFNADLIIYTEGKSVDLKNSNTVVPDCTFFYAIFTHLIPNGRIKIKAIGNKDTALSYADTIIATENKNSFVIIDRDYQGVLNHEIKSNKIILTDGYSWENDLWNETLIENLLEAITFNNENLIKNFKKSLASLIKRVKYLSILDAIAQSNSKSLLSKSKSLRGLSLRENSVHPISLVDVKRLTKNFKSFASEFEKDTELTIKNLVKFKYQRLIQGHFWQNLVTKLIGSVYKTCHNDSRPSDKTLLIFAIQEIKNNIVKYTHLLDYYNKELQKVSLSI